MINFNEFCNELYDKIHDMIYMMYDVYDVYHKIYDVWWNWKFNSELCDKCMQIHRINVSWVKHLENIDL